MAAIARSSEGRAGSATDAYHSTISSIHMNRPGHRNSDIHMPPGVPPPMSLNRMPLHVANVKRMPAARYRAAAKKLNTPGLEKLRGEMQVLTEQTAAGPQLPASASAERSAAEAAMPWARPVSSSGYPRPMWATLGPTYAPATAAAARLRRPSSAASLGSTAQTLSRPGSAASLRSMASMGGSGNPSSGRARLARSPSALELAEAEAAAAEMRSVEELPRSMPGRRRTVASERGMLHRFEAGEMAMP